MGGSVKSDKETGEVHWRGYNNGIFYTILYAQQVFNKLLDNPKTAREKVILDENPQVDWLVDDPVIAPDSIRSLEVRLVR